MEKTGARAIATPWNRTQNPGVMQHIWLIHAAWGFHYSHGYFMKANLAVF